MKIVDVNILLYAVNRDSEQHDRARAWLDGALGRPEPVGFAWSVVLAFLRISTHPAVFARPLTTAESVATMRAWLSQPSATIIDPTSRHLDVLAGLIATAGTAGNLVNDAHLAALTVESAAELISFDPDFERFAGLRWSKPTAHM
ncbi:MAG: type II toxin-antitoxin system VapC family toxin [Chloroflexota bacterium]